MKGSGACGGGCRDEEGDLRLQISKIVYFRLSNINVLEWLFNPLCYEILLKSREEFTKNAEILL